MNRNSTLVKNTAIFAIGSFSTKLLQFLLIPLYTRVLTDYQYGVIDILQTIATLIIPIVSLTIYEAVFRYSMEDTCDKKQVLSIGVVISFINIIIFSIIGAIFYKLTNYQYVMIMILYISTNIIRSVFSQFTRAIGKLKVYTIDNILNILVTIVTNIVLIVKFNMNIDGYLLGYIVGNILSVIVLVIFSNLLKYINFKNIEKALLKKMLRFSLPLIPNAICWWVISFIDRIMITNMYGAAVNGIYSIANKIPTIITILVGIFFDAWQISANKEFKSEDISNFYSEIFAKLFSFVFLMSSIIIPFSEIIIKIITGEQFWNAWIYMPVLLLSTSVFALAQFLGSIYTASKNTKMAFVTNIIAAIVNFVLNIVFLNLIGPIGAAISTMISYFVLWIYRVINTRKIVKIKYNYKNIIFTVIFTVINIIATMLKFKFWYILCGITVIAIFYMNFGFVLDIFNTLKGIILKKRKE